MIEAIVNKIIKGGISIFSKKHESTEEKTQLRIYFNEEKQVKYDACVNWQPIETVTFKQILNKKLDLLNYEQLSTPIFNISLLKFSKEFNIENLEISIFIFLRSDKLGLAVFKNSDHIHTVSLNKHLSNLLG